METCCLFESMNLVIPLSQRIFRKSTSEAFTHVDTSGDRRRLSRVYTTSTKNYSRTSHRTVNRKPESQVPCPSEIRIPLMMRTPAIGERNAINVLPAQVLFLGVKMMGHLMFWIRALPWIVCCTWSTSRSTRCKRVFRSKWPLNSWQKAPKKTRIPHPDRSAFLLSLPYRAC